MEYNGGEESLATITRGEVPTTRMANAEAAQDLVRRLLDDDEKRSKKRAKVDGLVDGNPPYTPGNLRSANRSDACNVNWGTARSYLESGVGAFYDLASQAPGIVQISQSHGPDNKRVEYSRTMSEVADEIFLEHPDFDTDMQVSQTEMVLHCTGPLYFEDGMTCFPVAVETADLLIPERTKSKLSRWELAVITFDYYPVEVYEKITDEAAATKAGWDVEYTRDVIQNSMDIRSPDNSNRGWEYYQTELKSNSLAYYGGTKICRLAHVFWREFDNRITHAIVERQQSAEKGTKYLYLSVGKYESFEQVVHPMYYDRGRGGYYHNVTGLGVKMYGPMEYENRTLCGLMDKANAPKTLFKPTTADVGVKFQLVKFGDFAVMPPGVDVVPNPIQGFLTDGLAMFRTSSDLMRSNLSSYRQPVAQDKPGNPATKFEKQLEATQQSSLSNTTFNRFYKQLDSLYSEIVRRLCNLNSTCEHAKEFQKRCMERGVPKECFGRVQRVVACRVIGEGSPFMRQQTTQALAAIIQRCSEEGQNNWLNDFISSHAGQSAVSRYNPQPKSSQMATDQQERARNQVAGIKIGMPPAIAPSQNALTFAGVFLQSCVDAITSVQKGANPQEVLRYLEIAGRATAAHLQRLQGDPLRADILKQLTKRWEQVAKMTDQLKKQVAQAQQLAKAQQKKTQAALSDEQLKQRKVHGELQLKAMKTRAGIAERMARTRQDLQINDAKAASEIHHNRLKLFSQNGRRND